MLSLFLFVENGGAHHQPMPDVWFYFKFVDNNGKAIKTESGLVVLVEVGRKWKEVDIERGEAVVKIGFVKNYSGPLKIKVYDYKNRLEGKKREVSLYNHKKEKVSEIIYAFEHRVGSGLGKNKKSRHNDGVRFLSNSGQFVKTQKQIQPIQLEYGPKLESMEFILNQESDEEEESYSVATGDIDGDGDIDFVVGNYGKGRVYINDGKGFFKKLNRLSESSKQSTYGIALGDIDGDGDLDLVEANNNESPNVVYKNDGKGNFKLFERSEQTNSTTSIALGDIDGDGDLDLIAGNIGANDVYKNDGKGRFVWMESSKEKDITYSVALSDIDGDGDLDYISGNNGFKNGGKNRVYKNDGKGSFSLFQSSFESDLTYAVALGDLDGDKDSDLVVGNYGHNRIYINDGSGKFTFSKVLGNTKRTSSIALGDIDGDGKLDILSGNNYSQNFVYLNRGDLEFKQTEVHQKQKNKTYALALAHLNQDMNLDYISINFNKPSQVYLQKTIVK